MSPMQPVHSGLHNDRPELQRKERDERGERWTGVSMESGGDIILIGSALTAQGRCYAEPELRSFRRPLSPRPNSLR